MYNIVHYSLQYQLVHFVRIVQLLAEEQVGYC